MKRTQGAVRRSGRRCTNRVVEDDNNDIIVASTSDKSKRIRLETNGADDTDMEVLPWELSSVNNERNGHQSSSEPHQEERNELTEHVTMDFYGFFAQRKVTPGDLANHLFLPKRLPHEEEGNLPEIEQTILEYLNHVAGPILEHVSLPNTNGTISTWMKLQEGDVPMSRTLTELKEKETACLYVRKQNCTILFTKLSGKYMRVATFRSSLPNENITGTCGSMRVTYPETMDIIPISSLLSSQCFSDQLMCLSSNMCRIAMTTEEESHDVEPREPSSPYVISDFLVGMLCPVSDSKVEELKRLQIQKKFRDQINLKEDCLLPFRRSGLYTSLKVILQLTLNDEIRNRQDANILYKIITLEMLTSLADDYTKMPGSLWDITAHMLTKLARRAKKLLEMKKPGDAKLSLQRQKTLDRTWSVIDKIHASVSQQWNSTISASASISEISQVHRSHQEWIEDCMHNMSELTDYLNSERLPATKSVVIGNLKMINSIVQTQTVSLDDLLQRSKNLSSQQQDVHLNDASVWLYQVEWFARHKLHIGQPCGQIFDLMDLYFKNSYNLYGRTYSDPVYYSRMAITGFKFIAVLDEIAVGAHPLLGQYNTGIEPEMFHDLLIPEKCEMKLVEQLQDYFAARNSKATHENWVKNSIINRADFCVEYAKTNSEMQELKQEILGQMEKDVQAKRQEIKRVKKECKGLQRRIQSTSCSYTGNNSLNKRNEHKIKCTFCNLESQLNEKRKSVTRYQRPLPCHDYLRNAIVFELLIPLEIVVLRDGLTTVLSDIMGYETFFPTVLPKSIRTDWMDFHELEKFRKTEHQIISHLGSQSKDNLAKHLGHENPDVLCKTDDDFILNNGLGCKYYRSTVLGSKPNNSFTMRIKKSAEEGYYNSLQFALNVKRTTENEVLAKQFKCHQNLTFKEFITFGSLRCAPLVQLRNLYAGMATKVLSLEKEPVLQLIMQSLWELGPGKREIHVDFELDENKQFSLAFLDLLRNAGEENATNWSNPVVFLCLTVCAGRILELSESVEVKKTAAKVLYRFRKIVDDWCIKLEELLVKTSDIKDTKMMMDLLLKSAICLAFTFNFSSDDIMPYVFKNTSDVTLFLQALSRLHHLVIRENILSQNPPSTFLQNILRHARHAIPLNVHDYLSRILSKSKFNVALHHFVTSKWYAAQEIHSIPTFEHSENQTAVKKHAYKAKYHLASSSHNVCVDILRGTFFVDGYPPSVLPESIIRNPLYTSFFQTNQFRVQRDSRTFKTVDKYRGLHFEFTETDDRLIIRQVSVDGHWFELLPSSLLEDNVAHDFIQNFTHWFDSKSKSVYFRRPSSSDTEENIEDDTDYNLVPVSSTTGGSALPTVWLLRKYIGAHEKSGCHVISIKSTGFQQITRNLKKLELECYVHVHMNRNEESISVNLWRYNLTFSLNHNDGLLYCENYPGYYLPPTTEHEGQNIGTLVGLQNGLLLEKSTVSEPSGKKQIFIIQHGQLELAHKAEESDYHQTVTVKAESVKNPPYFVYEVDQILKRLHPGNNKLAWLYLAALHGSTSSPFPDPFTQLTGTEMAMWILQCGFPWSCSPYDPECIVILHQISALSPKHCYYHPGQLMQNVQWPTGLDKNFYAAYDGYFIIVQKLLEDSLRLEGLFTRRNELQPGYPMMKNESEFPVTKNESEFPVTKYESKYPVVKKEEECPLVKNESECSMEKKESDRSMMMKNESQYPMGNLYLCKRSYYRNINLYNKVAQLSSEFLEPSNELSVISFLPSRRENYDQNDLVTLAQYRLKGVPASNNETITSFIMTSDPLPCNLKDVLTKKFLPSWLETNLRRNWLELYSCAWGSNIETEHELTLIFGAMLYSGGGTLGQLLNLHNISVGQNKFNKFFRILFPEPVKSTTDFDFFPLNSNFIDQSIKDILRNAANSPPQMSDFETYENYKEKLTEYENSLQLQTTAATSYLESNYWPKNRIDMRYLENALSGKGLLNSSHSVLQQVNDNLMNWYNNRNLNLFISEVERVMMALKNEKSSIKLNENRRSEWKLHFHTTVDLVDAWQQQNNDDAFVGDVKTKPNQMAMKIFSTGKMFTNPAISLNQQRSTYVDLAEEFYKQLKRITLGNCPANTGLNKAGLHVRLAPVTLLRDHFGKPQNLGKGESCYLGALVVVWAHLKRVNRLMLYHSNQEKYTVELTRELETVECENWNPLENPEWLLLELELDITIRSVQVDVARRMMEMPDEKNGVMQLNMGEGKTSVIIPMILSTLSKRKDILCRVTVLNSIYATNYNLLGFTIGGFVNKRLYTVPCSRDVNIDSFLDKIDDIYKECVALGGALITLPEYRLSFRLHMYNCFLHGGVKEEKGVKIYNIESWLRKYARDLVDECDEIFSTKYQLIYTTGKQLQMDGGSMRWSVCQKLLEFLPQVATQLFEKYGTAAIEFQPVSATENPEKFTHFRILGDECKHDLCELMADGILDGKVNLIGRILSVEERKIVKEFLINENISEDDHNELFKIDGFSTEKRQVLLLVSGYLRRGILLGALKKRWRVEYGVKMGGANAKFLAVPFRAKDVPSADRTEFGHPDMAIVLTQLSYYYSGLSDEQLFQCFKILETGTTGPETVYNTWIKKIPPGKITSETVKTYKGINLADYQQRTRHLFPLLRYHKAVIDFWLENVAYPKECKQFPGKLITNAWDLCYERNVHPTTGFSGTNDTSLLLPSQITQQDLEVLKVTNAQMEMILKQHENGWKRSMEMGVECKELLQFMIKDGLRVLIDAGALMLQLGNEKIAELWLELDKRLEAVVYFNNSGELVTKVRQIGYKKRSKGERDRLLTLSQFKDRLENCAIYLDDQHTRGTDIKLPTHFKACVTVGSGMRRDKLIQACMRMRKLGKGQSVHFYLSHEVDNKIKQQLESRDKITVEDIIKWVKDNSYLFEKEGLVYWVQNAKNYAKNLAADDLFELSEKSSRETELLAERYRDPDAQKLQQMYGAYHHRMKVTSMISLWFSKIVDRLNPTSNTSSENNLPDYISETLDAIESAAVKKCRKHIPGKNLFHSMLEEEQEKELEPEQEVEEQRCRPPKEAPLTPYLHENVRQCVTEKNSIELMDGINGLSNIFGATTIKTLLQNDGWGTQCFATEDFIKVIESNSEKREDHMDSFIRPMRFFVSFKSGNTTTALLLSLYEVNCLVSYFRERKCSSGTMLHMFSGRCMDGQPIFANDARLQLLGSSAGFGGEKLDENVLAPLLIATGNLYFESMEEQKAFARFLGLRLRPWTEQEKKAFEIKQITSRGFVLPSCLELREGCKFEKNPTDMVIGILKLRNDVLRDADHTVSILDQCAYLTSTHP